MNGDAIKVTLSAIALVLLGGLIGLALSGQTANKNKLIPYELLEWTDGTGCKSVIWIDGQAYYGDHVGNVAGSDKFAVYRGNDYLVLPDKVIVREVEDRNEQ